MRALFVHAHFDDFEFTAALWKEIRNFEPDYLFYPLLAAEPLAGIHNDHETVAEAVRRMAYMINVPHAFLAEYPADEMQSVPCMVPVIINVYDGYMFGSNAYDLAVVVEEAFPTICEMTWGHQSQISEWLPWVGRHEMEAPANLGDWSKTLRRRFAKKSRELEIASARAVEAYTVTAWGAIPDYQTLLADFPSLLEDSCNLEQLRCRLRQWRGDRR